MHANSTLVLFSFARAEWRGSYMLPHSQLPHIADRTTNWDPRLDVPIPELRSQQPTATTSPGLWRQHIRM